MRRFLHLLALAAAGAASIATSSPSSPSFETVEANPSAPVWTGEARVELATERLRAGDTFVATTTFEWTTPETSGGTFYIAYFDDVTEPAGLSFAITILDEGGTVLTTNQPSSPELPVRLDLPDESFAAGATMSRTYVVEVELLKGAASFNLALTATLEADMQGTETETVPVSAEIVGERLDEADSGEPVDTAGYEDTGGETEDTGA